MKSGKLCVHVMPYFLNNNLSISSCFLPIYHYEFHYRFMCVTKTLDAQPFFTWALHVYPSMCWPIWWAWLKVGQGLTYRTLPLETAFLYSIHYCLPWHLADDSWGSHGKWQPSNTIIYSLSPSTVIFFPFQRLF